MNLKLGGIHELTFTIPHFINEDSEAQRNPHVDSIKEKMLLKVVLSGVSEWFIVDSIEEDGSDEDLFNVTAFSLGYELTHKNIPVLENATATYGAMMREVLDGTSWSFDEDADSTEGAIRTIEMNDVNALDAIIQMSEAFNRVILWDTNNKKVSFKKLEEIGVYKGLRLDYGKLLKTIRRERTTDELVTRLYAFGNEGLGIAGVNPTGQSYIEDFSYFMYPFKRDVNTKETISSSHFMSDELCHAILDHKALLDTYAPQINNLMKIMLEKEGFLVREEITLDELKLELQSINYRLDTAKASEDAGLIARINEEKYAKESEIASQTIVVNTLQGEVDSSADTIDQLRKRIANQSGLEEVDGRVNPLLEELKSFIIEKTWSDDRYIDAQELFDDANKRFQILREPNVVITVDIENLFEMIEEQYYWDKLNLGDIVEVSYPHMNLEYRARIIEINFDFESGSISVTISKAEKKGDEWDTLDKLLSNARTASTILENHKYKWDKVINVQDEVYRLINDEWDANKRKIVAGVNNQIEIGNRGIILTNPDLPNEMVIMQAGIIALSQDGGDTWKTAIKPDGIVAERIVGNLIAGRNLIITNGSKTFTVDEDGVKIVGASLEIEGGLPVSQLDQDYVNSVNVDILEAKKAVDNLNKEITEMFGDSKITELEAITLELSLKRAISESADIISIANELGITTEKTQYSESLDDLNTHLTTKYILKDSDGRFDSDRYPIDVTATERQTIQTKFTNVESKKSILVNAIIAKREQNANSYTDNMKLSIDSEIGDINNKLDGLLDEIGDSFRDGIIDEVEAISIQSYINGLQSEKADLDSKYTLVYTNTSLVNSTVKNELLANKNSYNVAHGNLISTINNAISDRATTPEEKQEVDSKFASYRTALANLSSSFEKAIDAISAEKARVAENNAKNSSVGKGEVLNGVKIDVQNGLVVTTSDSKTKVTLNASRGFSIQKNTASSTSPNYSDVFSIDANGNVVLKNGVISWGDVNAPSASQTGALPSNSSILTKLTSDGVYTGSVTTNQLVAGTAKITTGMIENLVVGTNVSMGANASISWSNVSNRPTIPTTASDVGALPSTYINSEGVWTGKVNANTITTGTLSGDKINGGTITGVTISGTTINGATINGGTISVDTNISVGDTLTVGANFSDGMKEIRFRSGYYGSATLNFDPRYDALTISAGNQIDFYTGRFTFSGGGIIDFSDLYEIEWGKNKPTAVFG